MLELTDREAEALSVALAHARAVNAHVIEDQIDWHRLLASHRLTQAEAERARRELNRLYLHDHAMADIAARLIPKP